ncbi:unnamed protein product [Rhodiola kirilowii]
MYQNMYNNFGNQDFGEASHTNFSIDEYAECFLDDWFESQDSADTSVEHGHHHPVYQMNEDNVIEQNHYAQMQNEETNTVESARTVSVKVKEKVAFKTKSDVEILDDGFKWRKYGKKMVKNSPNPRNYYKCSVEKCPVKKRVERDREDPGYVITTYEGVHNHISPSGY